LYKDINEYRRKKRLKQFAFRAVPAALVLLILFALLNLIDVFGGTRLESALSADGGAYPLTIKDEQLLDVYSLGSSFAVLTKSSLLIYNSAGERVNTFLHGYTNPVVKEGEKRLLTYDRGGLKLRVDASSGTVGELTMENTILTAEIASNGNVAVILGYKSHAPTVIVYDANLRPIYRAYPTEDFTAAAFSSGGDMLAVCSIVTKDGILGAKIYEMDITRDADPVVTQAQNIVPLALSYQPDGGLLVVGKENICRFPAARKSPSYYTYQGQLQRFSCKNGSTALLLKDPFSTSSTVAVIGGDGMPSHKYVVGEEVLDLYADGSRVTVLGKKQLFSLDMTLTLSGEPAVLSRSLEKVVCCGEYAYALGVDTVERFRLR